MSRRAVGSAAVLACCAVLLGAAALAQVPGSPGSQAAPTPAAAPPAPPAPQAPATPLPAAPAAIPLPDVATRAEDAARVLREMAADVAPESPEAALTAIESAIPERKKSLERKATEAEAVLKAEPSLKTLGDLEGSWTADGAALDAWRKAVTERATALEARIAQLGDLEKTWRLTLDQARSEHAPDALIERARSVLADIRSVQSQAQAHRAWVLTLQDQVARLGGRIDEEIDRIRAARGALRGRLFEADQPPLWRAFGEAEPIGSIAATVRDALARDAVVVGEYAAQHVPQLV